MGFGAGLPACVVQALGLKPKVPKQVGQAKLDQGDLQRLLSRGEEEGGGPEGAGAGAGEEERVKGLGFAAGARWGGSRIMLPLNQ